MMQYRDHHIFRIDDLRDIKKRFDHIDGNKKIILTTEKDAVRLMKFKYELHQLPFYNIPVRHHFLFGEERKFHDRVIKFITEFKPKESKSAVIPQETKLSSEMAK
jgi:tetraacyldisaccharide 4'-kinase